MVKVSGVGKPKIDTFFKVETGGRIIADGIEIEGVDIDRLADANTDGHISARGASVRGRVGEAAMARGGGSIDLSHAVLRNVGTRVAKADPANFARDLSKLFGRDVSPETASKIIEAFKDADDIGVVEERAKKLGIWEVVGRASGLAGIADLILKIFQ